MQTYIIQPGDTIDIIAVNHKGTVNFNKMILERAGKNPLYEAA